MAVLTATAYRNVCSATSPSPVGDDASPSLPTRVVLPKKKPLKWSTGVAPGEYGGPPTTTKLRKYWGGRGDEDPVTATDDFIWNKEFMSRMQRLIRDDRSSAPSPLPFLKEPDSGFLSLNRAMSLDSVDIDLSNELRAPPKPVLEQQVEAARRGLSATKIADEAASPRWRLAPTRREQAKWDKANKAATGGSDVILRESKKTRGDPRVLAEQSREQYFKLKRRLQLLTVTIGGTGAVSAYFSYSPEIAVSFGVGLLGSLVYMRMLGNSIDSMADGARGLLKILVPNYGFVHLELIPMLVGFFTYKIATFVQVIQDSINVVDKES